MVISFSEVGAATGRVSGRISPRHPSYGYSTILEDKMKKRLFACLLIALAALCAGASAEQTLPGIGCFSPGLVRLDQKLAGDPALSMTAEVKVDNALYARDLSVLAAMLDGTTIRYDGDAAADCLRIERQGETLFESASARGENGVVLSVNGETFAADAQQELETLLAWDGSILGTPVLERVPLADVAAWLESLEAGDALMGGFAVSQPFAIERTMSDDGTRLTKINIEGSVAREGEAPWAVTGFLRQPAGRAPKDTFELVLTQDESNYIELSYSALRENTVTRKNAAGTMSVRTALKAAGLIEGSRISSRLSVSMKNAWQADGENLSEKLTLTATLTHQDNTPGRRMQRLNAVEGTLKNVIRITTRETQAASAPLSFTDDVTLEIVMDGNTFAAGAAAVTMTIGEESRAQSVHADAAAASDGEAQQALDQAVRDLAAGLYRQLGEDAREKVQKGL